MWIFLVFLIVLEKGHCFPELCLQDTDAFRYTDTGCGASANALWLMPSVHRCSTLLGISCPSSSRGLQLSLIHDHAEGHVFSRPSGHTLFPLLSTFPHPLLFLHSNASQLSGIISDLQRDYWNLLHLSKVWWTLLSAPSLWLYLAVPISV